MGTRKALRERFTSVVYVVIEHRLTVERMLTWRSGDGGFSGGWGDDDR
jgi:hypothetical protein